MDHMISFLKKYVGILYVKLSAWEMNRAAKGARISLEQRFAKMNEIERELHDNPVHLLNLSRIAEGADVVMVPQGAVVGPLKLNERRS